MQMTLHIDHADAVLAAFSPPSPGAIGGTVVVVILVLGTVAFGVYHVVRANSCSEGAVDWSLVKVDGNRYLLRHIGTKSARHVEVRSSPGDLAEGQAQFVLFVPRQVQEYLFVLPVEDQQQPGQLTVSWTDANDRSQHEWTSSL